MCTPGMMSIVDLRTARRIMLTAVGLATVSAGLTLVFLGMRSVMDVGGACASGGPYVSVQPCPEGVAGLIPLGILGGLFGLWIYAINVRWLPGPRLTLLSWSALFLSLGWNFWEYGLSEGPVWGWIICGVVFVLMGGLPLLGLANRDYFRMTFWSDAGGAPGTPTIRKVVSRPAPVATSAADSVTEALVQLAALHRQGALTDDEFTQAKRRILEDS